MSGSVLDSSSARPLLGGGKYIVQLKTYLRSLQEVYAHGNRKLYLDDLLTAYLLCFFNPSLRSLRTLSDWSALAYEQGHLRIRKLCRSTISDANALMDPALLLPILRQLQGQLPQLKRQDPDLHRLLEKVQIVDGSFFNAAADIAWALTHRTGALTHRTGGRGTHSKARLDVHLDGGTLLPCKLIIHGKSTSEAQSLRENLQPAAIYVMDRGYVNFALLKDILQVSSDFVLRAKDEVNFRSTEEQVLDESDRATGVLSDRIGMFSGSPHTQKHLPRQTLREVVVFDEKHPDKLIRLFTSVMDVPAKLIAQLYLWRWQIELFFRWLKVHANFKHLISHNKNGMSLGFHAALIAVLLMYLKTARPMSKYGYNLLSLVASGYATMGQILPILEAREKECEKARQWQARRRESKTSH